MAVMSLPLSPDISLCLCKPSHNLISPAGHAGSSFFPLSRELFPSPRPLRPAEELSKELAMSKQPHKSVLCSSPKEELTGAAASLGAVSHPPLQEDPRKDPSCSLHSQPPKNSSSVFLTAFQRAQVGVCKQAQPNTKAHTPPILTQPREFDKLCKALSHPCGSFHPRPVQSGATYPAKNVKPAQKRMLKNTSLLYRTLCCS